MRRIILRRRFQRRESESEGEREMGVRKRNWSEGKRERVRENGCN